MPDGVVLLATLAVTTLTHRCGMVCLSGREVKQNVDSAIKVVAVDEGEGSETKGDKGREDSKACGHGRKQSIDANRTMATKSQHEKHKILAELLNSLLFVTVDEETRGAKESSSTFLIDASISESLDSTSTAEQSTSVNSDTPDLIEDVLHGIDDSRSLLVTGDNGIVPAERKTMLHPVSDLNNSGNEIDECIKAINTSKVHPGSNNPSGGTFHSKKSSTHDENVRRRSPPVFCGEAHSIRNSSTSQSSKKIIILQEQFPIGARVEVLTSFAGKNVSIHQISLPRKNAIGSVVALDDDIIVVRLDGNRDTTRVSASQCSVINESCRHVVDAISPSKGIEKKKRRERSSTLSKSLDKSDKEESHRHRCNNSNSCEHEQGSFQRSRTIKEALRDGGWTLKRAHNHAIYRREIVDKNGEVREMSVTMGKTNSDFRGDKNTLSRLNKFNRRYAKVTSTVLDGRLCKACGEFKPKSGFSTKQWNTGKNKCKDCLSHA